MRSVTSQINEYDDNDDATSVIQASR